MKKVIALLLVLMLVLSGCGQSVSSGNNKNEESEAESSSSSVADATFATNESDMFTDRDTRTEVTENGSVKITLNGDSVSCSSSNVSVDGTKVTIKDEGTYIISGTLNDGMIIVDADDKDKPQLVFNGVNITSKTSAPLYILEADKVFVTLQSETTNTLANGGTFTAIDDNNIDATVFSKQDLTFNGSGSLTVTTPAGHGIVCKDDLVFTGGTYTVTSASHGIDANDSVRIASATITMEAGKDGIHAENSDDTTLGFVYIASGKLDISAEGDGISAGSTLQIEGGDIDIVAGGGAKNGSKQTSDNWGNFGGGGMVPGGGMMPGGGRGDMSVYNNNSSSGTSSTADTSSEDSTSIKGMKAEGSVLINSGTITIDSADDAIHSNSSITVNGGTFNMASGDDGIHADDTLTITAGTIKITESYEGLEGLHINVNGGDISLVASDDGLNAAGGTDSSGFGGNRGGDRFGDSGGAGAPGGGMGGQGSAMGNSSSNGSIVVSGGKLYVKASGDGLDANGTLEISGGYTVVLGPNQGDTATLDYDASGAITGGTFIGTGASGMAQTFSSSSQGVVAVSVGSQTAGTKITLTDSTGKTIIEYTPELAFSVVILSSKDIIKGQSYTINVGSASGTFTAS